MLDVYNLKHRIPMQMASQIVTAEESHVEFKLKKHKQNNGNISRVCAKVRQMLGSFSLPDVWQHKQQRADDDSLEYLPVATEVCHTWHQQLTSQHHKTGHHGHGKTPPWQAQLDPWQREKRRRARMLLGFLQRTKTQNGRVLYDIKANDTFSRFSTLTSWIYVNRTLDLIFSCTDRSIHLWLCEADRPQNGLRGWCHPHEASFTFWCDTDVIPKPSYIMTTTVFLL